MVLISFPQKATSWRCFSFSKQPATMTHEASQQTGHMTPASTPSVMNHVMPASYGEVSCQNITTSFTKSIYYC